MNLAVAPANIAGISTACIVCGSANWQTHLAGVLDYLTNEHFDIDRCQTCGLMVTRPFPADHEIDRYYPARYRGNRHGFTRNLRVALRRKAIESRFPSGFRGRLLDIGCGDGAFVTAMKKRGWDVCATEIDPATVGRLKDQQIDAKLPDDAQRDGFGQPFDAITCWHVMEHVERPQQVANWARTQLKPAGVFQTTVPNIGCLQAKLFGRQWMHLDVPRHRYHFTPATFTTLLQNGGFSIEHTTCFAFEYDWLGIIQSVLNTVCTRPNILFEKLSLPPEKAGNASIADTIISYAGTPLLAGISLPPMLIAWMLGDGATLTFSCAPV